MRVKGLPKPEPGAWVNSASGRPVGRVIEVIGDRMRIVDVDNGYIDVDVARITSSVADVLVLDCELRSLRAEQHAMLIRHTDP